MLAVIFYQTENVNILLLLLL